MLWEVASFCAEAEVPYLDSSCVLEPNEDGFIAVPSQLPLFDGYIVIQAALGQNHSLFLTTSGLCSTGDNEFGQLGHSKLETVPGLSYVL